MLVDVVIPAREEQVGTLIPTIKSFRSDPRCGNIIVVDDGLDPEIRNVVAVFADYVPDGPLLGKGQAVMKGLVLAQTDRVAFCDGDLSGFTPDHAAILLAEAGTDVVLGVPDLTPNVPWRIDPEAWTLTTGQRSLPRELVTDRYLHGYCMEVQVNALALKAGLALCPVPLAGCKGAPRWSRRRQAEMVRDYQWLKINGAS